ncbi:MAG: hypothetical protein DRP45_03435 [Candidatus Zixiibacteriota bacterium]|nr:MAG: hypothetical protein DRP45_03435 [candidate division Zixibacteria bacterium]
MEIGPLANDKTVQSSIVPKKTKQEPEMLQEQIADKVQISRDARKKLADLADQRLRTEQSELENGKATEPNRIEKIRRRIETGFYNRPEIRDKIADKLIDDSDK